MGMFSEPLDPLKEMQYASEARREAEELRKKVEHLHAENIRLRAVLTVLQSTIKLALDPQ